MKYWYVFLLGAVLFGCQISNKNNPAPVPSDTRWESSEYVKALDLCGNQLQDPDSDMYVSIRIHVILVDAGLKKYKQMKYRDKLMKEIVTMHFNDCVFKKMEQNR